MMDADGYEFGILTSVDKFHKHNGSLFEDNEWVTEHTMIKNEELWNNIISQCLSRMYL